VRRILRDMPTDREIEEKLVILGQTIKALFGREADFATIVYVPCPVSDAAPQGVHAIVGTSFETRELMKRGFLEAAQACATPEIQTKFADARKYPSN
jgi:hypothetical protein